MSRYDNDMHGFEPNVTSASEQGSSWRVSPNRPSASIEFPPADPAPAASAYSNVYDFETARRLKQEETIASGWRNPYEHMVPDYGDSRGNVPVENLGYNPEEVRVSSSSLVRGSRLTRPEIPNVKPPMDLESYEPSAFDRSQRYARKPAGPRPNAGAGPVGRSAYEFDARSVGTSYNSAFRNGEQGPAPSYGGAPTSAPSFGGRGNRGGRDPYAPAARSGRDAYAAPRSERAERPERSGGFGGFAMPSFGFGGGSDRDQYVRRDEFEDAPAPRAGRSSRSNGSVRSTRNSRNFGSHSASNSMRSRVRDDREGMMEEEEEFAPRRGRLDGLKEKMDKRKRESRHKRADRDFETHVPKDRNQNANQEGGPRAALHKGEMGRSQKKAQRMQMPSVSLPNVGLPSLGFLSAIPGFFTGSRAKKIGMIAACFVMVVMLIYPPAQDYYITMRSNMQMQAELEAIDARNAEIQKRIDTLSTDEGIEDKVRDELGWVKKNEHAVSVGRDGSSDIGSSTGETSAYVGTGSVRAPDTWYSGFLDFFFGYDNSPIEVSDGTDETDLSNDPDAAKDNPDQDAAGSSSSTSN